MMKPTSAFAGGLDLPGHGEGSDMRATLLRVLTDLYLQRPAHAPEDERYYTELVLRLIEATGISSRAELALRLARYPSAPRRVIERLARDAIEVAAPILQHSPCLARGDLEAIAHDCGDAHATIVADRLGHCPVAARRSSAQAARELSELFYAADAAERRLILINLDYAMLTPSPLSTPVRRADVWRLESAALRRDTEAIVRELERTLGISRAQARRAVNDGSGEPIVVAGRAMNLPGDVMRRVLVFMNSRAGRSVERIHQLVELFGEISMDAARRLIAIWRAGEAVEDALVPPI
jgi:hypothetical protein